MDNLPYVNIEKNELLAQVAAITKLLSQLVGDLQHEADTDTSTIERLRKELTKLRDENNKLQSAERTRKLNEKYNTRAVFPRTSTRRSARGPAPVLGKPFTNNGLPVTDASASSLDTSPKRRGRRPQKLDTAPATGADSAFTDDTKLPGFGESEPSDV